MNWLKKIFDSADAKESSETLLVFFHDKNKQDYFVGALERREDCYIFTYDNNCPPKYRILNIDREINHFKYLPAFFTTRMPSRSRPELAESFEKYGDDPLKVLGKIGAKSAVSPYVFQLKSDREKAA